MNMREIGKILSGMALIATTLPASAAYILTSASCPDASNSGCISGDNYGFTFKIEDTSISTVFKATLTNTSPSTSDAVIDLLAFNLNPDLKLGTDFNITSIDSPLDPTTWVFSQTTTGGVQFDYVGKTQTKDDKVGSGEILAFDFVILGTLSKDFFLYFIDAESDKGAGIGGDDVGQVAVSFQTLGLNGGKSDLLASGWPDEPFDPEGPSIPEPGVLFLMGAGLLGLGMARRRKSA